MPHSFLDVHVADKSGAYSLHLTVFTVYVLHNSVNFSAPLGEDFETVLGRSIEQGSFDDVVFVVPTGRRLRLMTRTAVSSLCRKSGRPAGKLPFYTLESLVRYCAHELMGAKSPRLISDAYRLVLMEEAAEKADLAFFRGGRDALSPASLERLSNVIYGLKEDGVTPASLRDDVRRAQAGEIEEDLDASRLADIASLYENYEALLGSTLADYPRLLNIVSQILRGERDPLTHEAIVISDNHPLSIGERWERLFPGKTAMLLDGFSEFKKPEQEFLRLLLPAPLHVRIYLDYSSGNGPLFANFDETVDSLRAAGYRKYAPEEAMAELVGYQKHRHQPLVSYLRRWLFNTEQNIRHEGFGDMVQVIGAESRVDETRSIAKLVKHLTLNEHIPAAEIAVVMRQPAKYSTLFREMFALYDIPVNITDRYALEKSPVAIAVFAVLDTVLLGFRRGDVHRALQSPYIRCTRTELGQELALDAANMYEIAARLRIAGGDRFGGADGWFRRFDKRLEYLRRRLSIIENDKSSDADELREFQRELQSIERARKDFEALVHLLPRPALLTPTEFASVVSEQILGRLQVRERIVEFHSNARHQDSASGIAYVQLQEEVEKDARALSSLLRLIEELAFVYEDRFPGKKRPLQEYVDRLRTAVRAQRYSPREKAGYGVTITSIEQIRNIPYRVTILCGAIDSEFPAAYVPESFLGKELPDSEDRFLKRERLQFYQAITNNPRAFDEGLKKVYVTYPLYRGSEEIVRSSFVDALLKVAPLREAGCELNLVELRKMRLHAPAESDDRMGRVLWAESLGNNEELMSAAGRYLVRSRTLSAAHGPFADARAQLSDEFTRMELFLALKQDAEYDPGSVRVEANGLTPQAEASLRRYGGKPYSVTDLEQYKKCPYRYFVSRVLMLREKEEYDTSLSPLEQGNILHRILYRFYRELQDEALRMGSSAVAVPGDTRLPSAIPVQLDPDEEERYRELLLGIARDEIEHVQFDHVFFDLDSERLLGVEGKPGKLELWLREELRRVREGWSYAPVLFEFGFGSTSPDGRVELPAVKLADGVLLRGKIDRIEIGIDGDTDFLIGDYKTGRLANLPGNANIRRGESLQMPLYAAAARQLLREHYGIETDMAGAVYYSLAPERNQRGEAESHRFVMLPKEHPLGVARKSRTSEVVASDDAKQEMIDKAVGSAQQSIRSIADGQFSVKPLDRRTTCSFCSYGAVCRVKETLPE